MSAFEKPFTPSTASAFRLKPDIHGPSPEIDAAGRKASAFLTLPLSNADGSPAHPEDRRDSAQIIEEARQRELERGLMEGREEAGRMAVAGLAPGLRSLIDACSALGRESEQIEENTSAGSLVLALDVATRILGASPAVTPDQLSEVKPVLAEALGHGNRITLAMHPDDLAQLQRLVADEGLAWPDHPRIQFKADPSLSRGALRADVPEARKGAGEEQVMDILHRLLGESDS